MSGATQARTPHEFFLAALLRLLDERGHGAQRELAEAIKTDPAHLNSIVKGRRRAGVGLQTRIAGHFGLAYEDMIRMGRSILEGSGDVFPWMDQMRGLPREGRAEWVYSKTAEQYGLAQVPFVKAQSLSSWEAPGFKEYLAGEIDEDELFRRASGFFDELAAGIKSGNRS